jgi:uncharacterized repeat protein (TIGR03803 family)
MAAGLHAQSVDDSADKSPAGVYSLFYSFQCNPDAAAGPSSGLVEDSSGNLYGTAGGGQFEYGTVFKVTPSGTETVLHSFAGPPSDGFAPGPGSLVLDPAGNVYGVTSLGGEFANGTVYKVTATGAESVLYNFTGGSDGRGPNGGMARDSLGNLYGTTTGGGAYDYGVVFKLTPAGSESVLHSFEANLTNGQPDGASPTSNLTQDSSGNLYGTTLAGGAFSRDCEHVICGTVFEVTASGSESVLYSFKGPPFDGAYSADGGLLRDISGNLYGVTELGGTNDYGVVFRLTPEGTESVLLNFNGTTGGGFPLDGLAMDAAGNLYGTTVGGGSGIDCDSAGCGVLFELTTAGREIVLHDFTLMSPSDGAYPSGGVIRDPSGNLYGTLSAGGTHDCGAIFKFTP